MQTGTPAVELPRYSAYTRLVHWMVALFFVLALPSGFALFNPWLYHILPRLFGGGPTVRLLHPWLGLAFFLMMILIYRNRRADMRWTRADTRWLGRLREYVTNREGPEPPEVGKYDAGQKIWFWLMSVSGLVFLVSGIFLWFPEVFGRTPGWISHFFHDVAALVMLGGLAIHTYEGTIGIPGSLRSMIRGTVTAAWTRANHPAWYRQLIGTEAQNRRTRTVRRSG